jgi:hypothetical protein
MFRSYRGKTEYSAKREQRLPVWEILNHWQHGAWGRNLDVAVILWKPLENREMNIWVSHETGSFLAIWETIAFSSTCNTLLYGLRNICTSMSWWSLQPPPSTFPLTASLLTLSSSYLLLCETYRPVSAVDKAGLTGNAADLHSAKPRFLF